MWVSNDFHQDKSSARGRAISNVKSETEFQIVYKIEVHISVLVFMKNDKPSTSVIVVSLIVYVIVLTIIIIVAKTRS